MKMKHKKIVCMAAAVVFMLTANCATPMGMAASNIPLQGKQIKTNLGPAEGSASDWGISLFCLTDWAVPDIDLAIKRAIEQKKGEALINVRWYSKDTCAILANYSKIVVTGEAVELELIEAAKPKRK